MMIVFVSFHFVKHSNSLHREREINNLVRKADFNNDEYVQEFGLTISNSMMEVRGRVLPPPRLQYGGRGATMSGQVSTFHSNIPVERYHFIVLTNNRDLPFKIANVSSTEQS